MQLSEISTEPAFSWKFIQTIACWQNYGAADKKFSRDLSNLVIDDKFKIPSTVYRLVAFKESVFNQIIDGRNYHYTNLSSWTKKYSIARNFIRDPWFHESVYKIKNPVVVILKYIPSSEIIVDLDKLHSNSKFLSSIEHYENTGKYFNEGLEFGNSQAEVVLGELEITKDMIFQKFNFTVGKFQKT